MVLCVTEHALVRSACSEAVVMEINRTRAQQQTTRQSPVISDPLAREARQKRPSVSTRTCVAADCNSV